MTVRLRILIATSELAPWVKASGLADVAAGLGRALIARGHEVRVVMRWYEDLFSHPRPNRLVAATALGG